MMKKTLATLLALLAASAFAAVDVNDASLADLDSIKGIGPGTSTRIMEQRKSGKFKDWRDLIQRVSGIGDKRAVQLSTQGLTVNGTAYKPVARTAAPVKPKAASPMPSEKTPVK